MKAAVPARLRALGGAGWRRLKVMVDGPRQADVEYWVDFMLRETTPREWRMMTERCDDREPLPPGAADDLSASHPRLRELRQVYAQMPAAVTSRSQWDDRRLETQLDLRCFRGDNPFLWQYREWPRATILKYFILTQYIRSRDPRGLLETLGEDGAFGCWSFDYEGYGCVSRDLLDAVNEILFLDRRLGVLSDPALRVLDIGAGYGRMAHRLIQAAPQVADYCCVDAIPESTFLCEYYLGFRRCSPPARVVPLHEVEGALEPSSFTLAVNVHSFSECSYDAVAWWMRLVERLAIPHLLIVPNEPDALLTTEVDGRKRDFLPLVEAAGYALTVREPVIDDPAVRDLLRVPDSFFLFQRRGT